MQVVIIMKLNNHNLKGLRVSRKISLQEMAEALGFRTAGGYQRIEKGENKLKAEVLPIIANIFNLELAQLVEEIFFDKQLDETSSLVEGGIKKID